MGARGGYIKISLRVRRFKLWLGYETSTGFHSIIRILAMLNTANVICTSFSIAVWYRIIKVNYVCLRAN